jgi:hypothetical protein
VTFLFAITAEKAAVGRAKRARRSGAECVVIKSRGKYGGGGRRRRRRRRRRRKRGENRLTLSFTAKNWFPTVPI